MNQPQPSPKRLRDILPAVMRAILARRQSAIERREQIERAKLKVGR